MGPLVSDTHPTGTSSQIQVSGKNVRMVSLGDCIAPPPRPATPDLAANLISGTLSLFLITIGTAQCPENK
uniref:Uncharacterized protein n=1 Tax=Anguilla anguilla TaxID=7936 RepID=A0A0E9RQM7_ANGAN